MTTSAKRSVPTVLTTVGLRFLIVAMVTACTAPSRSAAPVAEPTQAPSGAPASTPEPTQAAPATAPPTDTPPTTEPTEPPATHTQTAPADTRAPAPPQTARYELVFEATWSADTHPTDFPLNPHFSPLIGAAHGPAALLWEVGGLASPGIKNMAETGGTSPLDSEIEALITENTVCATVSGGGIPVSPGNVKVTFEVNLDCPFVSMVTMIAPSPDWFVGVSGLSLLQDGAWVDGLTINLLPFDAGTDSGPTYASPNDPTASPVPIQRLSVGPLLTGGSVPPLGTFTFTRLAG